MQKTIPNLWFDDQAEEAAKFYTSVFNNSKIGSITRYDAAAAKASGQPEGSAMTVEFSIEGYGFLGLNGGPVFKPNPSISFIVSCLSQEKVDERWERLSEGGTVLMPLDSYPFSERYGWIQDRYGVSWQLILPQPEGDARPAIVPSLLFVGDKCGQAEEAINFYTAIFENSEVGSINRYGPSEGPDKEEYIMYADFKLLGQWFAAMDSALDHKFNFSEAVSFIINCETQEEVDYYWGKLSAVEEAEQCGWLKDKFGVSWQVVPAALPDMLGDPDPEKAGRAMEAMLGMKKIDIGKLIEARDRI